MATVRFRYMLKANWVKIKIYNQTYTIHGKNTLCVTKSVRKKIERILTVRTKPSCVKRAYAYAIVVYRPLVTAVTPLHPAQQLRSPTHRYEITPSLPRTTSTPTRTLRRYSIALATRPPLHRHSVVAISDRFRLRIATSIPCHYPLPHDRDGSVLLLRSEFISNIFFLLLSFATTAVRKQIDLIQCRRISQEH
jgi:hypothetical protein